MIELGTYRKRIGYFNNSLSNKKRKKNLVIHPTPVQNSFNPHRIFLAFLYYYFVLVMLLCLTTCISENQPTNPIKFIQLIKSPVLLNINSLSNLLCNFYLVIIGIAIRRSMSSLSIRGKALHTLFVKYNPKRGGLIRYLQSITASLYLWILLINFLLILICNPSMKNPGPLGNCSVFYCNVQGLIPFGELGDANPTLHSTKIHELNHFIYVNKPDIVVYNETWLKDSIHDSEIISTDDYKVFRLDRSSFTHPPDPLNSRKFRVNGGGVLIAIKHCLDIESKIIPVKCRAEILSIELSDKLGRKSILSSFYRVGTLGNDNHDRVKQYLHNIRRRRRVQSISLVGDLNMPQVRWDQGFSSVPIEQAFIDTFNDLSLQQLVTEPTHYRGNILDVILADKPEIVSGLIVDSKHGICGSDHYAMRFNIRLNTKKKKSTKRKIYSFKRANWTNLNNALNSENWEHLLRGKPVDEAWSVFNTKLTSHCNSHIPKISVSDEFQPPWFDSDVFDLCRKKERLHDEWKQSTDRNPNKYLKFSKARRDFKNLVDAKLDANFEDDDNRNLINKKFWSFVKSKSNAHRIPETVSYDGCLRSDPQGQCELFNRYFNEQFTESSDYDINIDFSSDRFFQVDFDICKIKGLLENIDPNKAQGADNIHGKILKYCSGSLSKPLAILFEASYKTGSIPADWKMANVVPIHKKGSKTEVNNYRPISLTSIIMKIYEKVIRDELLSRCEHLIDPRQHGFMNRKSCTTQLVNFCDSLALSLNDNVRTDIIYFDFQKAFDSVNHDIILSKLKEQYNIDGSLLRFFKCYLENRYQRVVIGNKMSTPCQVRSGVPQGSILGPTLFILFLNDITDDLSPETNISMYADDTKIWRRIRSQDDHWLLQRDISSLQNWARFNKMMFHPSKSHVLSITRAHSMNRNVNFVYSINETAIEYTDIEKDLGVHINNKLDWSHHCDTIYSKASQRLGLLKRTCYFTKNTNKRRAFYLSQVRSHFEHCTIIWRPHSETTVEKLESIQKRGLKWILNDMYLSLRDKNRYFLACKELNILPLSVRFDYKDILFFHNIFYDMSVVKFPPYLQRFTGSRLRRSHLDNLSMISEILPQVPQNLTSSQTRCSGISKSYFYRAHILWNKLPYELREISRPSVFKSHLIQHLWAGIKDLITS